MIVFRAKRLWEVTAVIGSSPNSKSWYSGFSDFGVYTSLGVIDNMEFFFRFQWNTSTVTRTPVQNPM